MYIHVYICRFLFICHLCFFPLKTIIISWIMKPIMVSNCVIQELSILSYKDVYISMGNLSLLQHTSLKFNFFTTVSDSLVICLFSFQGEADSVIWHWWYISIGLITYNVLWFDVHRKLPGLNSTTATRGCCMLPDLFHKSMKKGFLVGLSWLLDEKFDWFQMVYYPSLLAPWNWNRSINCPHLFKYKVLMVLWSIYEPSFSS